ncbi:MAG: delta-60 repeat domain-containing protein [Pyrinomonadaceae bacterium]
MNITNYSKITFSIGEKIIFTVFFSLLLSIQIYAQPGRLDLNFPQVLANDAKVLAIEIQPDGKILIAGIFNTRGAVFRRNVVRLNSDGSLDATFNFEITGLSGAVILCMKLQPDGKILVGGVFGNPRSIVRLNVDGSLDAAFGISGIDAYEVSDIELQPDGKILIKQANFNGSTYTTRLNKDGSVEKVNGIPFHFEHESGLEMQVLFVPTENKILLTGNFSYTVNQTVYKGLARFNLNGTIDPTFTANITTTTPYFNVHATLLSSGKILVWGSFEAVNGVSRRSLAILNSDGSLDMSFNPTINVDQIDSVAVQANGKIVISTFSFKTFGRGNVARLNANGTVDNTFYSGRGAKGSVTASVKVLKIRNDNKLLIGGTFFRYHIFPRAGLAQINL